MCLETHGVHTKRGGSRKTPQDIKDTAFPNFVVDIVYRFENLSNLKQDKHTADHTSM